MAATEWLPAATVTPLPPDSLHSCCHTGAKGSVLGRPQEAFEPCCSGIVPASPETAAELQKHPPCGGAPLLFFQPCSETSSVRPNSFDTLSTSHHQPASHCGPCLTANSAQADRVDADQHLQSAPKCSDQLLSAAITATSSIHPRCLFCRLSHHIYTPCSCRKYLVSGS